MCLFRVGEAFLTTEGTILASHEEGSVEFCVAVETLNYQIEDRELLNQKSCMYF